MIIMERLTGRTLLLILSLYLALPLFSAEPVVRSATADQPALPAASALFTNVFHPVTPGPIDGQIATATAGMLTHYHYVNKPFDEAVSSQFLDRYLEMLDPQHVHFTQADLAEFEPYRTNLNHLTLDGLPSRRPGDTTPACEIFNRFVERLQHPQRVQPAHAYSNRSARINQEPGQLFDDRTGQSYRNFHPDPLEHQLQSAPCSGRNLLRPACARSSRQRS